MTVFNDIFDTATPAGSDDPAEADDRMQEIKGAVQERENVDHIWDKTGTEVSGADTGEHRKILFHAPIATTPTVAANHGDLRTKDVSSKAELHWTDEDENELQLTSKGNNLANATYLKATNEAGDDSVDLIKAGRNEADDADVAIIPDAARMASNAAPGEDTGVANKKYVDDQIIGAAPAIKAWVNFDGDNGTIRASYNVTSVSRTATGKYTITWTNAFADNDYVIAGFCADNGQRAVVVNSDNDDPFSVGSIQIQTRRMDTGALVDCNIVTLMAVGNQ